MDNKISTLAYSKKVVSSVVVKNNLFKILSPIIAILISTNGGGTKKMILGVVVAFLLDTFAGVIAVAVKNDGIVNSYKTGVFSLKRLFQGMLLKTVAYGTLILLGKLATIYTNGAAIGIITDDTICAYLFLIEFKSVVDKFIAAGVTELQPIKDATPVNGGSETNPDSEGPQG